MTPADRIRELLAAEAAEVRLEDAEWNELQQLLAAMPREERILEQDSMHEAAALAQACFLADDRTAWRRMPEDLRGRLMTMSRARAVDTAPLRPAWRIRLGWAAAAAMIVVWLATVVVMQRPQSIPEAVSVQLAADAVTLPWGESEISGFEQVRGEIVWSDSLQTGEMRFAGLPVNDPLEAQYQLWIVDPDRDKNPVDGGVFDALIDGELLVPIDTRLAVDSPVAFAVTLEQPGGVVVSAGPLLLVAAR